MTPPQNFTEQTLSSDAVQFGFCPKRLARAYRWMGKWVDEKKLPFIAVLLARAGEPVFFHSTGMADIAAERPFAETDIVRIYSMTKPVTSVALLMLYEQGLVNLDDPVDDYLPELAGLEVLEKEARSLADVRPADASPSLHQLLTHQSGFTYGFSGGILGEAYEKANVNFTPRSGGLEAAVKRLGDLPLLFEPGTAWNYSVSTDVIGRVIEVVSGLSLDEFFLKNIFQPLGMEDTQFAIPSHKIDRLTSLYGLDEKSALKLIDEPGRNSVFSGDHVETLSGGGGLTSTMADYFAFTQMLRNKGKAGEERILGPRTVSYMIQNHLNGDIASLGPSGFSETPVTGVGFGLGVWSMIDPAQATMLGSPGDYGWGGIASTVFWQDPLEDLTVILLTQLAPSNTYPLRKQLRALVYQALCD